MTPKDFPTFASIFSDVLGSRHRDPILHILVLTYELDEEQLVKLVVGNNLEEEFDLRHAQLKVLSDIRPLVIYDAAKTKSYSKLPQFLELHPFHSSGFSCHHSKAYLIVTEKAVRLILGSFNLTETGLFKNREVYEYLHWDAKERTNIHLLRDWASFLESHYQTRLYESSSSALGEIVRTLRARIEAWPLDSSESQIALLHSGYDGPGLAQLRVIWKRWFDGEEPGEIVAVSPFFDLAPEHRSLAGELLKSFPAVKSLTLVTDHLGQKVLSKAHFGGVVRPKLLTIPSELSDAERTRLESARGQSVRLSKDQSISRKLHAKVLLLIAGEKALIYMGSANFSCKAWKGENQELGLVWADRNAPTALSMIWSGLNVQPADQFPQLPTCTSENFVDEDDEGYEHNAGFPEFIEHIVLMQNDGATAVRFRFEQGVRENRDQQTSLDDYTIFWDRTQLHVRENYSQWIDRAQFQSALLRGRNLELRHKNSLNGPFWFPFQYDGNLVDERETFILPSAWDWMEFYLSPAYDPPHLPGQKVPRTEDDPDEIPANYGVTIAREQNVVIAMQTYLTLFARIEREFTKRLASIRLLPENVARSNLNAKIVQPLEIFSRLLLREGLNAQSRGSSKGVDLSCVFKVGELLRLVLEIKQKVEMIDGRAFSALELQLRDALAGWQEGPALGRAYIEFVLRTAAA